MADGAAPALKPGEVKIDLGKLNGNEADAGEALAGLFAEEPEEQEIRQEGGEIAQPADTGQEETPATGDEEGQTEQPQVAAIEPPNSWTAEEKQLFTQLPPELQQAVVRRDSEREKLTLTQSQKATEEAKRLEAERQQVANDRAQQVTLLQSVLFQLTPELQRFQNIDWDKLAREKPAEWAQERQAFDGLQLRWNMAQGQIARIQDQQRQEADKQQRTFLTEQYGKLIEKVPEFADKAKFKAAGEEIAKYLPEFTAEEISGIADHRQFLAARDAMLYRKAQALRLQAQTKKVPATPVRAPLKPAARQGNAREEAQARELGALHETLRKSGTTQAAADLLVATGMFNKH